MRPKFEGSRDKMKPHEICNLLLSSTLFVAGLHFGAAPIVPPQPSLSRSQSASSHHHEIDVLSDLAVQISHFYTIFKRSVNRPQSSVAAVFALEPATLTGDSKAHQQLHNEAGALATNRMSLTANSRRSP
ncbi:hypothetical protein HN873_009875, partial [Arachis hypogaea]